MKVGCTWKVQRYISTLLPSVLKQGVCIKLKSHSHLMRGTVCACARTDASHVATDVVVFLKKPFQLVTSIGNSTERSGTAMPDKSFLCRSNRLHSNAHLTPVPLCLYHEERKSKSVLALEHC